MNDAMGQVLYRKYRSRSLNEVVGQDHIVTALSGALKSGKVSHAYLLTGPRGTGKTSVARILAHELNSLPYSDEPHFDIIEIDAASNNGVEDVRALREKVQSAPASAKYKVYIIDEVHMLSKPAFNALLKTLEEPPEHVIFILATTEVHKLPETIISRTQRYSFRPVALEKVTAHLRSIAEKEKIKIDDDALHLIAEHGEGSFRDSISLLDQASTLGGEIHVDDIETMLGRAPRTLIAELLEKLAAHDGAGVTSILQELYNAGYEPAMVSVQLGATMRGMLTNPQPLIGTADILGLLRELIGVPASHRPGQLLELILLGYALEPVPAVAAAAPPKVAAIQAAPKYEPTKSEDTEATPEPSELAEASVPEEIAVEEQDIDAAEVPTEVNSELVEDDSSVDALWQSVLQAIKQTHNTLYGIARMAKPVLQGDSLTLTTKFPFHQKRLNEPKNRDILARTITELRGKPTAVTCMIAETQTEGTQPAANPAANVATISNIFGGAELL